LTYIKLQSARWDNYKPVPVGAKHSRPRHGRACPGYPDYLRWNRDPRDKPAGDACGVALAVDQFHRNAR